MNLIHLNLMVGVSLDRQSKETPAMKTSGKMGNSPKFQIVLRPKENNPAVHSVDRSQVSSLPFESQSSHSKHLLYNKQHKWCAMTLFLSTRRRLESWKCI
jgi:hypothetical protein